MNKKLIFVIYATQELPDATRFTQYWQECAEKEGLPGFHFIAHMCSDVAPYGCAGSLDNAPFTLLEDGDVLPANGGAKKLPTIKSYRAFVEFMKRKPLGPDEYPLVFPNFDNTPRAGSDGFVLHESTPQRFKEMMDDAVMKAQRFEDKENNLLFIKAWNEWAEGNHLEPDTVFGRKYLEVVRDTIAVEAHEKFSDADSAVFQESIDAVEKGDWDRGLSLLTRIERSAPFFPSFYHLIARCYEGKEDYLHAVTYAIRELQHRPDNESAFQLIIMDEATLTEALRSFSPETIEQVEHLIYSYV